MQASPIHIPTVSNDTDWDFCFHLSQQAKIPAYQKRDELYYSSGSGESEEDIKAKEEKAVGYMALPKEKLAHSQKKITQLIKKKMNTQANKELIRCVILSRIIFGEEHWKCAQALASLAYGYLTLRGLPAQAKKHAESAKNTLLTWKGSTASNKEKKEILEALVMLYYTLGVAWLLQNHGREAYFNLQKAERNMKELKELYKGGVRKLQVSEKDLTIALGRASLAIHRLNLALAYFEKAIDNVIAAKGDRTLDLVSLYEEIAQIEQLRRNHDQAIQYLEQAYSICVSLFTEVSPQTAEASALLAKAHAMSGEAQHRDAVEIYFIKSISAYQATLGPADYETLTTIEEFCKWLVQNGEKQEAYRLLKASLKSQVISYGDCSEKVAETFYNMGRICFAKGELRKAIQLLQKCLMIQIFLYGSEHSKSRDTKDLLTLLQRASNSSSRWRRETIPGRRNCLCKGPEV
ncbi:tetratricopeptide repeat protein 23-like isoform X3 [Canis lupus baileyi]|nr:tetratricopeptide repeat protein 23-like isoform X3 [Canis lupus familiaris]XP_005619466.1 tetratricopeptide repeat protein 23-like isoform X3 [Canis lupus familiaris]XP_022273646.1 tetratricopeptide repeat protein 23-like isoform X3 [Canis lupus familiaris]XP_035570824.1 tetratricopeptide repeat protein 23-like isoform X3 [Canis lupus dingo]XP_035570825.1 tetratricopeptide repeat protein 23-like isoform X3 [Canis lupus dingo]XP_035570826.1 tetratricopeptide repeat protein 23-like isoform X|eukprot:XP_005619465.1 tetratricopeptide repeat protein 23-like isoform X3 [Canis lupus familiaris]